MSDALESKVTQRLLGGGESDRLVFVGCADDPHAVGEHVCALLNGNGGTVLAGVEKSGRVVAGAASEAAADSLRKSLVEHIAPRSLFTVSLDEVASGPVIAVDVPGGRDKPYAFDGIVCCRNGTATSRATAAAMQRMVEDRSAGSERWERRAAPGLEIDDLDAGLIRQTVHKAENARGYQFADRTDQHAVLNDLSLLRHGQLTHAADVLFGMRVAVREPQTRMRAVRYATDKGDRFIDEQLFALATGEIIRTRDYMDRFAANVTERQARRDLVELERAGYFRRSGTGVATVFERTQKHRSPRPDRGGPDMSGHASDMTQD